MAHKNNIQLGLVSELVNILSYKPGGLVDPPHAIQPLSIVVFTHPSPYDFNTSFECKVVVVYGGVTHRPDTSRRHQRQLSLCPLVIALVTWKWPSRYFTISLRKKCLCALALSQNEAYRPMVHIHYTCINKHPAIILATSLGMLVQYYGNIEFLAWKDTHTSQRKQNLVVPSF